MAEEALETVLAKPDGALPNTRNIIRRQLAYIENYFFAPDRVVKYLTEIGTPALNDLNLLMAAVWEYITLGKYDSASGVLDVIEGRMSDLHFNGGDKTALADFRTQYMRARSAAKLAADVTRTAPYLPVTAVLEIQENSPSSGGGLMVGDLVYGVNGLGLHTPEEFTRFDWTHETNLKVWRDGAMKEIKTVLQGTAPLQVRQDCFRTLRVMMVKANSPASRAGIKRGDILLRQGTQPIDSPPVLKHLLETAKGPLSIDLFSPESEVFRMQQNGNKTSWRGTAKTVQVTGKELGIEFIPWFFSQPLLTDKTLPAKAGW